MAALRLLGFGVVWTSLAIHWGATPGPLLVATLVYLLAIGYAQLQRLDGRPRRPGGDKD